MTELEEKLASLRLMGLPEGIEIIENEVTLVYIDSGTRHLVVPEIVEVLGEECCLDMNELEEVTLNNELKTIKFYAFARCSSLREIRITQNIDYIDASAFNECGMITEFKVSRDNKWFSSIDGILYNKEQDVLVKVTGCTDKYELPESVKYVEESAFAYCELIKTVRIPKRVKSIGEYAFFACRMLVYCKIDAEINSIGDCTFASCKKLIRVDIPDTVEAIGRLAFEDCLELKTVVIPKGVVSIGDSAFRGCRDLILICYEDSYGLKYAMKNNIEYIVI